MNDGILAQPVNIGGLITWKIISLRDKSVIAKGPTINEAVRNIPADEEGKEVAENE